MLLNSLVNISTMSTYELICATKLQGGTATGFLTKFVNKPCSCKKKKSQIFRRCAKMRGTEEFLSWP